MARVERKEIPTPGELLEEGWGNGCGEKGNAGEGRRQSRRIVQREQWRMRAWGVEKRTGDIFTIVLTCIAGWNLSGRFGGILHSRLRWSFNLLFVLRWIGLAHDLIPYTSWLSCFFFGMAIGTI